MAEDPDGAEGDANKDTGDWNESDGMSESILSSDEEKETYERMKISAYKNTDSNYDIAPDVHGTKNIGIESAGEK